MDAKAASVSEPAPRSVVERVRAVLATDDTVTLAYLFGSRARGDASVGSDVDVAVLFARPVPPTALAVLVESLERAVNGAVDLVDLASAPPLLCREVVRDGIRLVVRDEEARFDFECSAVRRAEDTRALRGVQQALLRERAARGAAR